MKPQPTKSSHSANPQKVLQRPSETPPSTTVELSQDTRRRSTDTQEINPCHFSGIFFRLTSQNVRFIEFKRLLLLLINQGLGLSDIFHLLSTSKSLHRETYYIQDWKGVWTTLDDKEIFEPNDIFHQKMSSDLLSFQQNPGWFRFSLNTCYLGMSSANLQQRIENTIQFFSDPANSIYLRNCALFEIYLSQETLDPKNTIWDFVKSNNLKLALSLQLNPNEVKAFGPVFSLIEGLDPKILDNVHSFHLDVVIGNKNLKEVKELIQKLKKCKSLASFRCDGIGTNTTFTPDTLPISYFKCKGDITAKANLQLNSPNLTRFTCFDIKNEAAINLSNLHHFICFDIFHTNFQFNGYKFLTTIKCHHIKASASVKLTHLQNLVSFESSDIAGSLVFGEGLNNLRSIKVKNLTLRDAQQGKVLLRNDLPSLTAFECGDLEGPISFSGNADNLVSVKCGSLKRKEIKAPKPKPTKSRTQATYYYPENRVFNGNLSLPSILPNLTSLFYDDIEVDDDNFDLPTTPKLEKISFGKINYQARNTINNLRNLKQSLNDKHNT